MRTERAITSLVAFGVSITVGLLAALVPIVPAAADTSTLPNPVTGGFSPQAAGALLGMGLLAATMTVAFAVMNTAEILAAKDGNLKNALGVLVIMAMLTLVLLLVVADGPLIAVSFLLSLPFAAALSSKIPVQSKKQKQDRWTWS